MNDTASQAGLQACVEFTDGCSEQFAETSRPLSGPRGRMSISEVIRSVCRLNVRLEVADAPCDKSMSLR